MQYEQTRQAVSELSQLIRTRIESNSAAGSLSA